jgi:hypothetical protein
MKKKGKHKWLISLKTLFGVIERKRSISRSRSREAGIKKMSRVTSPSAVRPVDEPFGHELKAEWLRSSRSGPNGDERRDNRAI